MDEPVGLEFLEGSVRQSPLFRQERDVQIVFQRASSPLERAAEQIDLVEACAACPRKRFEDRYLKLVKRVRASTSFSGRYPSY